MLHPPLNFTTRLVRQQLAWRRYAIRPADCHHLQTREFASPAEPNDSVKAPRRIRRYTAEEDSIVRGMAARNCCWQSIADALPGRSFDSVRSRWQKALSHIEEGQSFTKTSPKRWTEQEINTLFDMIERGFHLKAIAQKLGRTYLSVQKCLYRPTNKLRLSQSTVASKPSEMECSKYRMHWQKEDDDQLKRLRATGLKSKAIAIAMGRSIRSVQLRVCAFNAHPPRELQSESKDSVGSSAETRRASGRWTIHDDKRFEEMYNAGVQLDEIANHLGRTVIAVQDRLKGVLKPRLRARNGSSESIGDPACSDSKLPQQPASKVSQLGPQPRRNFSTLHNWTPRFGIDNQERTTPLTYGSHRIVSAVPWKRRGVFSLPYRPQQRLKHTVSTSRLPGSIYTDEEVGQIIDLRAANYTWVKIGEILSRSGSGVRYRALAAMKEEAWSRRFEAVKPTVRDDEKYLILGRFSAKEDAVINEMRNAGKTFSKIAEALNRPRASVETR